MFQSDSLTLESVNGSLKVLYTSLPTHQVCQCVYCVLCMRVEKREGEDTAPPLCYVEVCEEGGEEGMVWDILDHC